MFADAEMQRSTGRRTTSKVAETNKTNEVKELADLMDWLELDSESASLEDMKKSSRLDAFFHSAGIRPTAPHWTRVASSPLDPMSSPPRRTSFLAQGARISPKSDAPLPLKSERKHIVRIRVSGSIALILFGIL